MKFEVQYPNYADQTDDWLFELCSSNRDLRIERDAFGQIIIMSPTGGTSSQKLFKVLMAFMSWVSDHEDAGYGFESSAGFVLPNGAMRAPDAAWVSKEKWNALSAPQKEKFPPITPDFVIEVRSNTDSIKALKNKMNEWIESACQLGWLIDPIDQKVFVYQKGHVKELNHFDQILVAEDVVTGMSLDLRKLK